MVLGLFFKGAAIHVWPAREIIAQLLLIVLLDYPYTRTDRSSDNAVPLARINSRVVSIIIMQVRQDNWLRTYTVSDGDLGAPKILYSGFDVKERGA
jgi:hypothetical protein